MKKLLLLVLVLLLVSSVSAADGRMKLLAVTEDNRGSVADLHLEILENGKGNVFINTYPLTKLDTQISTRFAKEIACDFVEKDCNHYDFIYTITSDAPIVGGPSAGAAITILTISLLEDLDLDESATITGTINSGGFIGAVGGLRAKVEAASEKGLKKVYIPNGESFYKEDNETVNLSEFSRDLGVEIIEVSDMNDALFQFTGRVFGDGDYEFDLPDEYVQTMKYLADQLCKRTDALQEKVSDYPARSLSDYMVNTLSDIKYLREKGENATESEIYYSAASYCFAANVMYQELIIYLDEVLDSNIINYLDDEMNEFESELNLKKINTITDLQAYAAVKERLIEAQESLDESRKSLLDKDNFSRSYAYASERFYSARSWAEFFGKPGKKYAIDQISLQNSCNQKIDEAEERFHYVNLYLSDAALKGIRKGIDKARDLSKQEEYELCLYVAGRAKAESDVIINAMGVDDERVDILLDNKLMIARKSIAKNVDEDVFPILGYSYYEYSQDLRDSDKFSALLFSEYALELSNLDIYFEEQKFTIPSIEIEQTPLLIFIEGAVVGFIIGIVFFVFQRHSKRKKKRLSRKRRR